MGKKISNYRDSDGNKGYHFHCEGCGCAHGVFVEQAPILKDNKGNVIKGRKVPVWGFNGNEEKPTFTPSIKVQYPHLSEEGRKKADEFHKKHGRYPTQKELPFDKNDICHSFVTDGKIRYLNDCTHHLKGQTVELLDF